MLLAALTVGYFSSVDLLAVRQIDMGTMQDDVRDVGNMETSD